MYTSCLQYTLRATRAVIIEKEAVGVGDSYTYSRGQLYTSNDLLSSRIPHTRPTGSINFVRLYGGCYQHIYFVRVFLECVATFSHILVSHIFTVLLLDLKKNLCKQNGYFNTIVANIDQKKSI